MISERHTVGGLALWRYVTRAIIVARLDKLNSTLRADDAQSADTGAPPQTRLPGTSKARIEDSTPGMPLVKNYGRAAGIKGRATGLNGTPGSVALDERNKELIRMKIERLDAAKAVVEREHALHNGGPVACGGSGGSGGRSALNKNVRSL